jgi:hypothetical protein
MGGLLPRRKAREDRRQAEEDKLLAWYLGGRFSCNFYGDAQAIPHGGERVVGLAIGEAKTSE